MAGNHGDTVPAFGVWEAGLCRVCRFLAQQTGEINGEPDFKYILIGVGLTCVLILPENFSTAFMLFGVCFLMMFIGQLPFGKLAKLAGILMLALVLFLALLKFTPAAITQYLPDRFVTWQGRLERFFDGHKDNLDESGTYKITDDNYQVTHAKIAIARGGVFGQMPDMANSVTSCHRRIQILSMRLS